MAKPKRVARSREDMKQELKDQLDILRMACTAYDNGTDAAGKAIATSLRVLLYSYRQSRGLLDQLGYRDGRFISTAVERKNGEIGPKASLLLIRVTETDVSWKPILGADPHCKDSKKLSFPDWWSETIVIDAKDTSFSRMDLVMHVADTDGGAHVDPDLVESYMDLSRENSIGLEFGDVKTPLLGRLVLACMRQIAQEVIASLLANAPELGEHVAAIIPPRDIPKNPDATGPKITVTWKMPEHVKGTEGITATLTPVKTIE